MSRRPRADLIGGRDGGTRWPVYHWKSPRVALSTTALTRVDTPIPPHAAVEYAVEYVAPVDGYATGDHVRRFKGRVPAGSSGFHPAWDSSRARHAFSAGTQPGYVTRKDDGSSGSGVLTNRRLRLYGSWTKATDTIDGIRFDKRKFYENQAGIGILRTRAETPWVRGGAGAPLTYDMSAIGHGDEPALLALWARCLKSENGFMTGDHLLVRGDDVTPNGGGEIWHNRSQVGFYMPATVGWAVIAAGGGGSLVTMTPANWDFQLRMAFASDPRDDYLPSRGREQHRWVSMARSPWLKFSLGAVSTWQMPNRFLPIDIFTSLKCIRPANSYVIHDEIYTHHGGGNGADFMPGILLRGGVARLPFGASTVVQAKGGGASAAVVPANYELQFRAIG